MPSYKMEYRHTTLLFFKKQEKKIFSNMRFWNESLLIKIFTNIRSNIKST